VPRGELLNLGEVRRAIIEAERVHDVERLRELRAQALGVTTYVKAQRGKLKGLNAQALDVAEAALRAERAIGTWLDENVRAGGGHGRSNTNVDGDDIRPLPDGITRDQSSKWQQLARVDEDVFERAVAETREKGKLSQAAVLKRANQIAPPPPEEIVDATHETFNRVNDNIGWARWSWNPVTGCLHNCPYCYARDIAERFYPQGFAPTFVREALTAPQHTKVPGSADGDPAWRRVFTCSMADLFGKWVPQDWLDAVFEQIVAAPQWEFLCLTKFPQRLATLDWPDNVWAGTTVDRQHRVDLAQRHFAEVQAGVKWLSCEPLLEPLRFDSLEMFDWVVIGACTASTGAPEFAPPFDWVIDLYQQARDADCRVYLKHNLFAGGVAPGMEPVREWPR
jgi:protein gp37